MVSEVLACIVIGLGAGLFFRAPALIASALVVTALKGAWAFEAGGSVPSFLASTLFLLLVLQVCYVAGLAIGDKFRR
jgi:hypothetical protein